jgi:hypothetical protein
MKIIRSCAYPLMKTLILAPVGAVLLALAAYAPQARAPEAPAPEVEVCNASCKDLHGDAGFRCIDRCSTADRSEHFRAAPLRAEARG